MATIPGMLSPILTAALIPNVRNRKLLVIYTHCYEIVKKSGQQKHPSISTKLTSVSHL